MYESRGVGNNVKKLVSMTRDDLSGLRGVRLKHGQVRMHVMGAEAMRPDAANRQLHLLPCVHEERSCNIFTGKTL